MSQTTATPEFEALRRFAHLPGVLDGMELTAQRVVGNSAQLMKELHRVGQRGGRAKVLIGSQSQETANSIEYYATRHLHSGEELTAADVSAGVTALEDRGADGARDVISLLMSRFMNRAPPSNGFATDILSRKDVLRLIHAQLLWHQTQTVPSTYSRVVATAPVVRRKHLVLGAMELLLCNAGSMADPLSISPALLDSMLEQLGTVGLGAYYGDWFMDSESSLSIRQTLTTAGRTLSALAAAQPLQGVPLLAMLASQTMRLSLMLALASSLLQPSVALQRADEAKVWKPVERLKQVFTHVSQECRCDVAAC